MYYVISAKLAKQVQPQAAAGLKGYLVLNQCGDLIHSGMRKAEAEETCDRLNQLPIVELNEHSKKSLARALKGNP